MTDLEKRWCEIQVYTLADRCLNANPLKGIVFSEAGGYVMYKTIFRAGGLAANLNAEEVERVLNIVFMVIINTRSVKPHKKEIILAAKTLKIPGVDTQKMVGVTESWYYTSVRSAKEEYGENAEGVKPKAKLEEQDYISLQKILKGIENIKEVSRIVTNN